MERLNAQLFADLRTTDDPRAVYDAYMNRREDGHLTEESRTAMSLKTGEGYTLLPWTCFLVCQARPRSSSPSTS